METLPDFEARLPAWLYARVERAALRYGSRFPDHFKAEQGFMRDVLTRIAFSILDRDPHLSLYIVTGWFRRNPMGRALARSILERYGFAPDGEPLETALIRWLGPCWSLSPYIEGWSGPARPRKTVSAKGLP